MINDIYDWFVVLTYLRKQELGIVPEGEWANPTNLSGVVESLSEEWSDKCQAFLHYVEMAKVEIRRRGASRLGNVQLFHLVEAIWRETSERLALFEEKRAKGRIESGSRGRSRLYKLTEEGESRALTLLDPVSKEVQELIRMEIKRRTPAFILRKIANQKR